MRVISKEPCTLQEMVENIDGEFVQNFNIEVDDSKGLFDEKLKGAAEKPMATKYVVEGLPARILSYMRYACPLQDMYVVAYDTSKTATTVYVADFNIYDESVDDGELVVEMENFFSDEKNKHPDVKQSMQYAAKRAKRVASLKN